GASVDAEAAEVLESACYDGEIATACNNLGVVYETGRGRGQDLELAATHYELGCDVGSALSCSNLAQMHRGGIGPFTVNPTLAMSLTREACKGGSLVACANLGVMLLDGEDPSDERSEEEVFAEAFEHLSRACDGEDPTGCFNLAIMHLGGIGAPENRMRAIRLLRDVADQDEDPQMRDKACEELLLEGIPSSACG
ncbi:MAG: sel1 repeat family protein, partial [Caulobacterales bacterium]|nr:sel1 repeat family protein [Caulobacterales bacterium]